MKKIRDNTFTDDAITMKEVDSSTLEILIYGDIAEYAYDNYDLFQTLKQNVTGKKDITLRINSRGGDAFQAIVMYNILRASQSRITAVIDGLAASAASLVAMAADKIVMPENAFLMLHNPNAMYSGDAKAFSTMSRLLTNIEANLVKIYSRGTIEKHKIKKYLNEGPTYFSAYEALEIGLADEIVDKIDIAAFATLPDDIKKELKMTGKTDGDVKDHVEKVEIEEVSTVTVKDETVKDETVKEFTKDYATEVVSLCVLADEQDKISEYLKSDKSLSEIRNELLTNKKSKPIVNAALPETVKINELDSVEIYNRWNNK